VQILRHSQGRTKGTEFEIISFGRWDALDWIGTGSFSSWGGLDTDCSVRVLVVEVTSFEDSSWNNPGFDCWFRGLLSYGY